MEFYCKKKAKERLEKQRKWSFKAKVGAEKAKSVVILEDSSTNEDSSTDAEDATGTSSLLPRKRGRKEIISAALAQTLDRTNVSDCLATIIVRSTARSSFNIKSYFIYTQ